MDLDALLAEGSRLGQLAALEVAGDAVGIWDTASPEVKAAVPVAAQLIAQHKLLLIAGMDPSTVILPADLERATNILKRVRLAGGIAANKLLESTVVSVIVKALSLAGTLLRSLLGLA